MISYENYKMIHVLMVVIMFSFFAVQIFSSEKVKKAAMWSGIASVLLLVSGMGLLARIGVSHTEGWPSWVIIKMIAWALIVIATPMIIKRAPSFKGKWFGVMILILLTILYMVQYKPEL